MSLTRQAELAPQTGVGLELALLCDALDVLDRGAFLFAVCEEGALRKRLMQHVADHLEAGRRTWTAVEFSPDRPDLTAGLDGAPVPDVVFVDMRLAEPVDDAGIRIPEKLSAALRELNFQRERLSRLNVPLVFWISQNGLGQLAQHAADVFAARGGLFFFETLLRAPGAPPAIRAEATLALLRRFSRAQIPASELRPRAALYEQRLERQQSARSPNWAAIAFLCGDLASIYGELDDHEKAGQFQDRAIEACQRAIAEREVAEAGAARQERASLLLWLGDAYSERRRGERAENLERAIECYEAALQVYTRQAFPEDWAGTQNNLGAAYANRISGERAENLERALACYEAALQVFTRQAFPEDWARAQNNLGNAYLNRILGEQAENLERAIGCYEAALQVYTRQAFPRYHEMVTRNLELALAAARPRSPWERFRAALSRLLQRFRRSAR